jgi:hypothetical protein
MVSTMPRPTDSDSAELRPAKLSSLKPALTFAFQKAVCFNHCLSGE